jgi:hypothetical protein
MSVKKFIFGAALMAACSQSSDPAAEGTGGSGAGTGGSAHPSGGRGGSTSPGTGGNANTGGTTATGGAVGTGGSGDGTGGTPAGTGGAPVGDGGAGGADASEPGDVSTTPGDAPTFSGTHPQCPACKAIFDGKTLDGWFPRGNEVFAVQEGAIYSTGKGRGTLVSKWEAQDYRLIFDYKLVSAGHQATMVVFCVSGSTDGDCDGIQFQPPGTDTWDYRPGAPNKGSISAPKEMKVGNAGIKQGSWGQCEIVAKGSVGTFKAACCPVEPGKGCKGIEVMRFNDGKPFAKGPIAWQAHNAGHNILWKNIFVEENPATDDFITTK